MKENELEEMIKWAKIKQTTCMKYKCIYRTVTWETILVKKKKRWEYHIPAIKSRFRLNYAEK